MNKLLSFLFLFIGFMCTAQSSEKYNSEYARFYVAEELFEKAQYGAARQEFHLFIEEFNKPTDPLYQKALYYEGLSALELFNNDGVVLLEAFNQAYPESIYKHELYFKLANYYYQKKDFTRALSYYEQLTAMDVEEEVRDEFYFKSGYANFKEAKFVAARNAFHEVIKDSTHYAYPALYYYSHIAYQDKSYQTALEGFLTLQSDARFTKVVPYYIAQIYYLQGKYQEVVDYAPLVLDSTQVVNENDINHILGDAFYRVGKYDEAVPYLESYNRKSKTTREDDYALGYAYFRSKMYSNAVKMFDHVSRKAEDSLAQIAYYHIGECFLQEANFSPARSAFEQASVLQFDAKVQEDALYQYAVLSYKLDINPYDEAVEALELYLKRYPESTRKNDVFQYLVNVYTNTNNYSKALQSLDRLANKDIRLKTAYQIVAFNSGVEQFQHGDYSKAINQFGLVERYPVDPVISGKAKYWQAEAFFHAKNYDKSIQTYRAFLNLPGTMSIDLKADAYYNIGYAYYAKHDTLMGIESFRTYTQQLHLTNKNKLADACMRTADGYYLTKQNENAIKFYLQVVELKAGFEDQALFYLAKTYTFIPEGHTKKIKALLDVINNYKNSKYILVALEELALTYKVKGKLDESLKYYNQIVSDYPTSTSAKNARVVIAYIYYQKHEYHKSEIAFKLLLEEFGAENTICESAAKGLIDTYRATNQIEKAEQIMTTYTCAGFTANQQEDLYYVPAFEAYMVEKNLLKAIPLFEKYMLKYPNGNYRMDAKYQLATCYYETENIEKALELYKDVLIDANSKYTEIGAIRVVKQLYNNKEYEDAIPYYEKIIAISSTPTVLYNARLGLMRSTFQIKDWTNAIYFASYILENEENNSTIKLEAHYAKGMASYYDKSFTNAKISLEWIVQNTTTIMGAEAKYYIAEMYYQQNDLENSDKEVRALLKMKPAYNYWVAKALILQSRTLILKDDLFQAEQTLKSVKEHYPNQEDGILMEAEALWNELMQLKNKPKSVSVENEAEIEVNGGN
jgi:tetratricopeptide (TPR) repeat protein